MVIFLNPTDMPNKPFVQSLRKSDIFFCVDVGVIIKDEAVNC